MRRGAQHGFDRRYGKLGKRHVPPINDIRRRRTHDI